MPVKRVISFSVYGNRPLYTVGAIENADLARSIYPGWTARFYIDDTVPSDVVSALSARGAEIVRVTAPSLGTHYGRYWRAWVAADHGLERFIIRDVDSRLNSREKAAVDAWISSNKTFHLMRDSRFHTSRALGGAWGGLGGSIPSIRALTDSWGKYSADRQNDQFMSERIYPLMGDDYICHDSYGHFSDARPFPSHLPMQGTSFVGEIVTEQIQQQDVWRRLGEYEEELADIKARYFQLVHDLRMRDGPNALRMVLPLARIIRRTAQRLGLSSANADSAKGPSRGGESR